MSSLISEIIKEVSALTDPGNVPAACRKETEDDCVLPKNGAARERTVYGWHNPHLPPEMRSAILSGEKFEADEKTDIYIIMAVWYERICGRRAPCSFQIYGDWRRQIRAGDGLCGGLDEEERERLVRAVEEGTRRRREDRDPVKILNILKGTAI